MSGGAAKAARRSRTRSARQARRVEGAAAGQLRPPATRSRPNRSHARMLHDSRALTPPTGDAPSLLPLPHRDAEQVGIPTCKVAAGAAAAPAHGGRKAARQVSGGRASPPDGHGPSPPPPPPAAEEPSVDPQWALLLPQPRYPPPKRSSAPARAAALGAPMDPRPGLSAADDGSSAERAPGHGVPSTSRPQQQGGPPGPARHGDAAGGRGGASEALLQKPAGHEAGHGAEGGGEQRGLVARGGRSGCSRDEGRDVVVEEEEEEDESSRTCRHGGALHGHVAQAQASPLALPGGAPAALFNACRRFGPSAGDHAAMVARAGGGVRTAF